MCARNNRHWGKRFFYSEESRSFSMAHEEMRFAKTPIKSLYIQDIKAIGLMFEASSGAPFLYIRIVVADFHAGGTSRSRKQREKILDKTLQDESTRFKWRYPIRSEPGLVLLEERSFLRISSAEGALKECHQFQQKVQNQ